jgi:chemosensory pili system protein ChpB (putative protein-glutamate methylesterase)
MQPTNELSAVRIAIASGGLQQRLRLKQVLELNGLRVVLSEPLSRLFIAKLEEREVDALIVDVDEHDHQDSELLDELLIGSHVPVLINDISSLALVDAPVDGKWYRRLLHKLAELTGRSAPEGPLLLDGIGEAYQSGGRAKRWRPAASGELARNVWVLGASLGGPQALMRFLAALSPDVPVAFIVAQHLGGNLIALLARQLERVSPFEVHTPSVGHVLRHGQMLVAPVDERVLINPIGAVELLPVSTPGRYSPSIDRVLSDVAARYRAGAGAIIFSGLGDDGACGCQDISELGGEVWVQRSETCIVSSMPDHVTRTGVVSFADSPEGLAERLARHYGVIEATGS